MSGNQAHLQSSSSLSSFFSGEKKVLLDGGNKTINRASHNCFPSDSTSLSRAPFRHWRGDSRGCVAHRGQWRCAPEQRSRRIYQRTACQGDYWIKITIWHFSFSVLAQWTEGKLLQPSVPPSTLLITSLAPLQPLTEKSFCQNITQCTDPPPPSWSISDCWGGTSQSLLHSLLPLSAHTLHQCGGVNEGIKNIKFRSSKNRHLAVSLMDWTTGRRFRVGFKFHAIVKSRWAVTFLKLISCM